MTASSFSGNPGLCGPPLPVLCWEPPTSRKKLRLGAMSFMVCIACGISIVLGGITCRYFFAYRTRTQRAPTKQGLLSHLTSFEVTSDELCIATNGYSESNVVGSGGSSKVYKAVLRNGKVVAVKRFELAIDNKEEAERSFNQECRTLGKIRHRNLVPILGTCCNLEMKALILQYMVNGSLERHLFEGEACHLSWERRFNIVLDVANALVYLHHECDLPVIHCDLKPSNILLDEEFTAHVGDFGIARIMSPNTSVSMSHFRGSIGYIAPEYGGYQAQMQYSIKGDMYSYGIVLLCMVTRKQPTSGIFEEGMDISKWVGMAFPERMCEVVDVAIQGEVKEEEVMEVTRVALQCTQEKASDRPTARDVLRRLGGVREKKNVVQIEVEKPTFTEIRKEKEVM